MGLPVAGAPIPVTASFGMTQIDPEHDIRRSIKIADVALYEAKAQGRDRTLYIDQTDDAYPAATGDFDATVMEQLRRMARAV